MSVTLKAKRGHTKQYGQFLQHLWLKTAVSCGQNTDESESKRWVWEDAGSLHRAGFSVGLSPHTTSSNSSQYFEIINCENILFYISTFTSIR